MLTFLRAALATTLITILNLWSDKNFTQTFSAVAVASLFSAAQNRERDWKQGATLPWGGKQPEYSLEYLITWQKYSLVDSFIQSDLSSISSYSFRTV